MSVAVRWYDRLESGEDIARPRCSPLRFFGTDIRGRSGDHGIRQRPSGNPISSGAPLPGYLSPASEAFAENSRAIIFSSRSVHLWLDLLASDSTKSLPTSGSQRAQRPRYPSNRMVLCARRYVWGGVGTRVQGFQSGEIPAHCPDTVLITQVGRGLVPRQQRASRSEPDRSKRREPAHDERGAILSRSNRDRDRASRRNNERISIRRREPLREISVE